MLRRQQAKAAKLGAAIEANLRELQVGEAPNIEHGSRICCIINAALIMNATRDLPVDMTPSIRGLPNHGAPWIKSSLASRRPTSPLPLPPGR